MDQARIPGSMGRLAEGVAFFGREEVIGRAWDLLKTSNLLLLAPRRVGKSSLLNRMKEVGPARGYKTLYLSVPDAEDELPLLIGSIVHQDPSGKRAERFLLWLKRLREQYRPRWFFAGSIGLDSVARKLKLSGTIHDLQPIELDEFSPEKAHAYLTGRGRFYGWELTPETTGAILHAVEWLIPFHLNLVFEELRAAVGERNAAPSPALVEVALERLMTHGRTHFDHWDERLKKMLDARFPQYCQVILGLACHERDGVKVETLELRLSKEVSDDRERAEILRQLLDLLISDGYLVRQQEMVRFRSALLRRYWREVQR